jgi:predicted nucleic acid-binding protein
VRKQALNFEDVALFRKHLDKGEAEAIALAKQMGAVLLIVIDVRGRQYSTGHNTKVIGLLDCLVFAKRKKIIEAVKPLLEDLRRSTRFSFSQQLEERILRSVNE